MTTKAPSTRKPLVRRFARPAGFLVALVLFLLLPNAAASCSAPGGQGTIEGSLTGAEMITGSRPSLDADGELTDFLKFAEESATATNLDQARADTPIRLAAAAVVVLTLLGAAVQLIRARRARAAATVVVAAGTSVLVVVIERLTSVRWEPVLREAPTPNDVMPLTIEPSIPPQTHWKSTPAAIGEPVCGTGSPDRSRIVLQRAETAQVRLVEMVEASALSAEPGFRQLS